MTKITEITRRDIIDIIRSGCAGTYEERKFDDYEHEYFEEIPCEYSMCYYGRLTELEFLSRVYDLKSMPSTDSRFKNAEGDIRQHTINNDDWDENWVFSDPRFQLNSGSDESLLKFLCQMFHPIVRREDQPWAEILKVINQLLRCDGYELYEENHISGRAIYGWKEIETNNAIVKDNISTTSYKLKLIGEGSYAKVFKYKDNYYNKTFVIKRAKDNLKEDEYERFKIEFEETRKLNSPYIVEVYNFNEQKHEYIMEYMDKTLEKYILENNSKISYLERINIVIQILKAFKYIHNKGVLHRDISINNILIRIYEDVVVIKISDFGLVKLPESDLTRQGTEIKGSLNDHYNLEIVGFENYSMVHETYALTKLIYFIMTGRTSLERYDKTIYNEFVRLGISQNIEERYSSIDELKEAFDMIKEK